MRFLAIDIGDKRTGLAVGDEETGIISPVGVLEVPRGDALLKEIATALESHVPDEIVIGLPLNMDGTEGDRARIARQFGNALRLRCALPVRFQDERLTSYAADQALAGTGRTHREKKQIRDALAAVEILKDYFEARESA